MARDVALYSWARHPVFTLTVPLSTKEYKWVLANCWENLTNCGGVTCDGLASHPGGGGGKKSPPPGPSTKEKKGGEENVGEKQYEGGGGGGEGPPGAGGGGGG